MDFAYFSLIGIILFLAVILIFFGKKNISNIAFTFSIIFLGLWTLTIYKVWYAHNNEFLFWARLNFMFAAWIPYGFLIFILNYPKKKLQLQKLEYLFLAICPLLFCVLSLTPLIIGSISLEPFTNRLIFSFNIGHKFYFLYFVIYMSSVVGFAIHGVISYKGIVRLRLMYFVLSFFIAALLIILTNLVLPLFKIYSYAQYGPFFSILFILPVLYAILKYRLLDIQIIIKRSIYYFFLMSFIFLALVTILLKTTSTIEQDFSTYQWFSLLFTACIMVFIYPYLHEWLDQITERIFYQSKYDYQNTIRDFSYALNKIINLDEIVLILARRIPETLKIKTAALYLVDNSGYKLKDSYGNLARIKEKIALNTPLVKYLSKNSGLIFTEEIVFKRQKLKDMEKVIPEIKKLEGNLCLPLEMDGTLLGVLILGPKLSDEIYSQEDKNLLEIIKNQASTALQKAFYYQTINKRIDALSLVNDFALRVTKAFNIEEVFGETKKILQKIFGFNIQIIYSAINKNDNIQIRNRENSLTKIGGLDFPFDEFIRDESQIAIPFAPRYIEEIDNLKINKYLKRIKDYFNAYSGVLIPFVYGEEFIGLAVGLFTVEKVKQSIDLVLLATIAKETAGALNNSILYEKIKAAGIYNEKILENMLTGVILCDDKLKVNSFNKRAEKITGIKMQDIIGKNIDRLYKLNPEFRLIEKTAQQRAGITKEITLQKYKEINEYTITTGIIKLTNKTEIICILSDISTIKALQREGEEANRLSSLGTMAAGIAHEIQNPLTSLHSFAQMLPNKWEEEVFRNKYIEIVDPEIERINKLCKSLLQLGRPKKPEFREVNINEIFDEVSTLLSGEVKKRNAEIIIQGLKTKEQVLGDKEQLIQVVLNLLLNSLEALQDRGGKITIKSKETEVGYIGLEIQDTGKGMKKGMVDKIFDPFYSTKPDGSGLGMSIVHRIIANHNGKIEVNSIENKGTRYDIELPTIKILNQAKRIKS